MNFREYNQKQGVFKVIIPGELLEEEAPARVIDKIIENLNLSSIYESYSEEGNPAYHPKMMLKVLFYSYYIGIHSCRKIWDSLKMRADFIFLSGDQCPDFRTINEFRKRHLKELPDIFAQIVLMCERLGMIGFENLAIDGQKIHANANFRRTYNSRRLKERRKRVKEGIEKILSEEIDEHFTEEKKEKRLWKLKWEARLLDALNKRFKTMEEKGTLDEDKTLVNLTDAEAKTMRHKDGTSKPSYNHQSAVDEKFGITVALQTLDKGDSSEDIIPIVEQARQNTGGEFKNVLGDAGFVDYELLKEVATERKENFHMPDKLFQQSKEGMLKGKYDITNFEIKRTHVYCPAGLKMQFVQNVPKEDGSIQWVYKGTGCEGCALKAKCTDASVRTLTIDEREPYRQEMREKLSSKEGREIYMKRQGIVESGHGNDQKNSKWTQHHLRGKAKAALEFMLIRIGSNLKKIVQYRASEVLNLQPT